MDFLLGIAALVIALGVLRRLGDMSRRVEGLEQRIARLASDFALIQRPPGATPAASAPTPEADMGPAHDVSAAVTREPQAAAEADRTSAWTAPPPPADQPGGPVPPAPSAASPTPVPPRPAGPPRSLEERLGTRWAVWVGGLALALGGVFLVQYTIEAGLLGPGVRIALGALFAILLAGAGEWTRRREAPLGLAGVPEANIPAMLTGASVVAGFADVYAGYTLYGFFGPTLAFGLLAAVSLAGMAASLVHGRWLAALGILGAYVTPLLIASDVPNYWALYVYLATVTAAAFVIASARHWQWLAVAALGFSVLWFFPGLADLGVDSLTPHTFHLVAGYALAAAFLVSGLFLGPPSPERIEPVSSFAIGAYVVLAAVFVFARGHVEISLWVFSALSIASIAVAWRAESALGAVAAVAILVAPVTIEWWLALSVLTGTDFQELLELRGLSAHPEAFRDMFFGTPPTIVPHRYMIAGAAIAATVAVAGYSAQGRHGRVLEPIVWAAAAVYAPISMLVGAYLTLAGNARSLPLAAVAIGLAALAALATESLTRREARPGILSAAAIFATGAVAALALALTFALDGGSLTVALALTAAGTAWVTTLRPLPALRWLAAGLAVVVMVRSGAELPVTAAEIGATPLLNRLLYFYGLPSLAFWAAGWLMRRRADDLPSRSVEAAAILYTALLAFLQVRHYARGGDVMAPATGLVEVALQVATGLAIALGLEWTRRRRDSIVRRVGATIITAAALAAIVVGLLGWWNPFFTGQPVGRPVVNLLFLAYIVPAVLLALFHFVGGARPDRFRRAAALASVPLALVYLTLEVRRTFHGPVIAERLGFFDAEIYTYSAAWLVFGLVLLVGGILIRSQPLRITSAAVVLVAVGKVFLFDMAGLTGIWRAFSFIGLGLVLVGIGALYQRLLFPAGTRMEPPPEPPIAPQ